MAEQATRKRGCVPRRRARRILIAHPHGFCAGVWRALDILAAAERLYPPPLYCLNELVHNRLVVADLKRRGMRFVSSVDDVPPGATLLFSAHGVDPEVRARAAALGLNVIDATCPFVEKVHVNVRRYAAEGNTVLLIGTRGHDEVIGIAGEAPGSVRVVEGPEEAEKVRPDDPRKVAVVTQTTLSRAQVDAVMSVLQRRFPHLRTPPMSGVCYASTHRQEAVREIARHANFVIVLGSANSANSNRLAEVAREAGVQAALISSSAELALLDLEGIATLGLTAGASTPETAVTEAVAFLRQRGFQRIEKVVVATEKISLPLPPTLRRPTLAHSGENPALARACKPDAAARFSRNADRGRRRSG